VKKAEPADFPKFEADMLKVWDKEQTFQHSLTNRQGKDYFSFYDGPPFANGLPHYGHVVPSAIKDSIARYKTMQGYYVPRIAGWDTHGLPVEYDVEKQLGISGKKQILEMGVDKFNEACRDSVFRYKGEFEDFIRRLGRWVDLDNAYATLDDNYIESVWWVFAELHKKGLVYQGFRSMPYCPRCATPLSNFELNQGYQDNVEDPSVYVKFMLKDDPNTSLLAWTTTPWTLPANVALAVDAKADYVTVELLDDGDSWRKGELLILAKQRLDELALRKAEYKVVKTVKGSDLVGIAYQPLYEVPISKSEETEAAWRVYADDSVSLEDGSGILHVAPKYGETDLLLGQKVGLPLIESVDANGLAVKITPELGFIEGLFFKEADPLIIEDLEKKGRIFAAEKFKHTYPFCWRCDTPLFYYATPSWFVAVTKIIKDLVANNQKVDWVPKHIKDGRFGNWLAEARDWGVSRNRFWGSPIPIWQCANEHITVIGSLEELTNQAVNMPKELDLHRPGIDNIEIKCADCGNPAKRIEAVFDCWFESGSMPYASGHYPFEYKAEFEQGFPADFISEGLDQTRGWFYTLHVLATALFNQPAYQHVICHGIVVAADGKKLSKRLKNYPPLAEVFDSYGADILRFFMLSSPATNGEDVRFSKEALQDVRSNVFMTLWNVYSFFCTYAEIDNWQPEKGLSEPKSENVLDQWMLARLNQTITEVTKHADGYEIARATRPITELIDDLSNWYVRRSRRRFWKSEDDGDKAAAYATLHYVLVRLSQLLAPWSPFISDRLWRELTDGMDVPTSVHLCDWPEVGEIDHDILEKMRITRVVVQDGLSKRADKGLKVRQPLSLMNYSSKEGLGSDLEKIIADEVNVKVVKYMPLSDAVKIEQGSPDTLEGGIVATKLDTTITPELKAEGMVRDLIRQIQTHRKSAGLEVSDRITLTLGTADEELKAAVKSFEELIKTEALATVLIVTNPDDTAVPVKIGDSNLTITTQKSTED